MSRKDELLKLAELFHLQARRAATPAAKQTLRRMGQHYQNEAAHASDRGAERQRELKQAGIEIVGASAIESAIGIGKTGASF